MTERKTSVRQLLEALGKGLYEREEAVGLALLSAVAGESIFLLGPPGVAKSLIARRLKHAFADGKSFEYLMNKFSTPDEIFGPVSIKKLKDEDKYERLTDRYLPGANVVFLDEIWKAGPAIQNALLTVINEKIYRNGEEDVKVDIKAIISASNELPPRREGLEALWDRFLIRYVVTEIKSSGNFVSLLRNTDDGLTDNVPAEFKLSQAQMTEWDAEIDRVELPDEVVNVIQVVKRNLETTPEGEQAQYEVYDRRWKKIARLMRTSAFLNGRPKVDLMDCFLMAHCLWSHPEQLERVQNLVADTIGKHGYTIALNLTNLRQELREFEDEVAQETKVQHDITEERPYLVEGKYYEALNISNNFEGKYVKQAEFERLGIEEHETINLYDEQYKLTYKIKARRPKDENRIEIMHNSKNYSFSLKTEVVEKSEIIYKKPHPVVAQYWDERIAELLAFVGGQKKRLETESPQELEHLRTNLFVDARLAKIVEENFNQAVNGLNALEVRIEKLQHYYANLD